MENKQTAVEWLESELKNQGFLYDLDIEAAKAMEKTQILGAYYRGVRDEIESIGNDFEDFYNETYGKTNI